MFSANSTQVSSGSAGSGSLYIASDNDFGVIGQTNDASIGTPPPPTNNQYPASNVIATSKNSFFYGSFIITNDGSAYFAGLNTEGNGGIGVASATGIDYFRLVTGGPWSKIATSRYASAAIKSDGTLWTCGRGDEGMTGQGVRTDSSLFTQVGALTNWADVAVGGLHMVAVKTDGTLWAWGWNSSGVFGTGTTVPVDAYRSSPVQIGALTNWSTVFANNGNSAAIKTDGTLWTWGSDSYGQLGNNAPAGTDASSPVQVGALTNWTQVSMAENATMYAVNSSGALYSWGNGGNGAKGDSTTTNSSSPVQIRSSGVAFVYSQYSSAAAFVGTDGSLWAWGYSASTGTYSRFVNSTANASSPVQIASSGFSPMQAVATYYAVGKEPATGAWMFPKTDGTCTAISPTSGRLNLYNQTAFLTITTPGVVWSSVSVGGSNVYGVKSSGSLWAWGRGLSGANGDGTIINRSSPVQIGALTNWRSVAGGIESAIATKTDGTLWAWGNNLTGQLGDGTKVNRSSPVQIGALTTWSKISATPTAYQDTGFCAAIKTDGTLWMWGRNDNGNLGDITRVNKSSPVQVGSLTTWAQVSTGGFNSSIIAGSTAAIKTDGTLWTWGYNVQGQLGIGVATARSSPVQVGALTNWAKVSMGETGCVAIKTDGTLWTWGDGTAGINGTGANTNKSSPVQVGSATNWLDCVRSSGICVATQTDGSVWAWGSSNLSFVNGKPLNASTPAQIGNATLAGRSGWTQIAACDTTAVIVAALR